MKILTFIILTTGIIAGSLQQDVPNPEVPNAVRNAFSQNFTDPDPADVSWKKTRTGYEVDFDLANVDHSARYTSDGELLMVKMALNEQDLPPVIRQRIDDDFREFAIEGIAQVKTGDRLLIQVALDGPSEDRKVVFTAEGEIDQSFRYWN